MHRFGPKLIVIVFWGGLAAAQAPTPLAQLISEAESHNAGVQMAEAAWHAAEQGVAPASALPDPQVMLQQTSVGNPLPFAGYERSDFAYTGVGIAQAIPYPGKLKLQAAVARAGAETLRQQWEAAKRAVGQQVAAAYIQLAYLAEKGKLLEQQRALLAAGEQAAEARYRAGPGSEGEVLAAQVEQTKLLEELALQPEQRQAAEAAMRALLDRAPGAPDVVAAPLVETHLSASEEQMAATLPAHDPALAAGQSRIAGASQAVELARKNFLPDFSAQYMYQRTGPGFPDYYQWTLGMTLPFFHRGSRQQPALEQALDQRQAAQAGYQQDLQQDRYTVTERMLAAASDEQILRMDTDGLLPQAEAAMQAAVTAYADGRGDFNAWLTAWRQSLELQQEYWHTLADHETALSVIEQLTGVGHE